MAIKSHKSIKQIAESNASNFSKILKHVARLEKMNQAIKALLSPEMVAYCQVANYREGQIILEIKNAAIATLIRFQLPNLLSKIRQDPTLAGVTSISYYIQPAIKKQIPILPLVNRNLSPKNAQCLNDIAAGINDPKLKSLLIKLS